MPYGSQMHVFRKESSNGLERRSSDGLERMVLDKSLEGGYQKVLSRRIISMGEFDRESSI
jgi:hypothetical protein